MFQFTYRRGANIYKELTPYQTTFVIFDIVMGVNVLSVIFLQMIKIELQVIYMTIVM